MRNCLVNAGVCRNACEAIHVVAKQAKDSGGTIVGVVFMTRLDDMGSVLQ